MKTKTFLLLCLFLGIGLTQLSAQKGNNPHDTFSEKVAVVWDSYWMPIECDGKFVDYLFGTVTVYVVYHYKDGVPLWNNYHSIGEAVSTDLKDVNEEILIYGTGEKFTVKENDFKQYAIKGVWPQFVTMHFNLIGDMGHHYQGTVTMDLWNPSIDNSPMSVIKFICH